MQRSDYFSTKREWLNQIVPVGLTTGSPFAKATNKPQSVDSRETWKQATSRIAWICIRKSASLNVETRYNKLVTPGNVNIKTLQHAIFAGLA
jgi:hypothetical protein